MKIFEDLVRKIKYLYIVLPVFMLTGCGEQTSDVFGHVLNEDAMDDLINGVSNSGERANASFKELVTQYTFEASKGLKYILPYVIIISVVIGVLGLILVKKDQKVRRVCILWFIIAIPILMIAITYIVSYVAGQLLMSF